MPYSPSPSPRSSSPVYEGDSSPPSSPSQTPSDFTNNLASPSAPTHPFAGSTHANRKFREYEKKPVSIAAFDTSSSGSTRYRPFDEPPRVDQNDTTLPGDEDDDDWHDDAGNVSVETIVPDTSLMSFIAARMTWDKEISTIVENPEPINEIDFNGKYIGFIPPSIGDLKDVVVLAQNPQPAIPQVTQARRFARAVTSPLEFRNSALQRSLGIGRTGSLDRLRSTSFSSSQTTGGTQLRLLLASNGLRSLPAELFYLRLLTCLDLRSNLLTYLPPQICKLENLRELNISINRFRYLPSEIMEMDLISLHINPNNHFIPKPNSTPRHPTRVAVDKIRMAGSSNIPSLFEQCLRVLLQRHSGPMDVTNLEAHYDLPLPPSWRITERVRDLFAVCVPKATAAVHKKAKMDPELVEYSDASEKIVGLSVCPAPFHEFRDGPPVFVEHIEERFTWETKVAGKDMMGVPIPILWRGCSKGCLSFLDELDLVDGLSEFGSEDGIQPVDFGDPLGFSDDDLPPINPAQPLTFSDDEGMEL